MTLLHRIRRSRWCVVVQGIALAGMILQPVPMARSYWTDTNNDGVKEWVDNPPEGDSWFDADGDGDQMTNGEEAIYGSDPYRLDSDFDGLTDKDEHDLAPLNDPWAWSSDGSGYSDHDRYYHGLQGTPLVVNYNTLSANSQPFHSYFDADGDGIQNQEDPDPTNNDRDGDGIVNWQDSGYMDDPNNGVTPPDTTTDSDGDGTPDYSDPFPWGSYWYNGAEYGGTFVDSDGDTIPDLADPFPNGSFMYNGTEFSGVFVDQDGDSIPDPADPFPTVAGSHTYLGSLYPGQLIDSDGDAIPDWADAFPNGSHIHNGTEYEGPLVDQDGDGIPDWDDPFPTIAGSHTYLGILYMGYLQDNDGDTIPDWDDPFPYGSYTYNGMEYEGAWADQDNDGIPDPADPFPSLSGSYWYNGTEYGGPWIDTDTDGVPDAHDSFPNGSYWYTNTEYAGTWIDTDSDGIPDPADPFPTLSGSYWYGGTEYGGAWIDTDNDSIPDPTDPFPNGSYWYNNTEYAGSWVDSDGDNVPDPADTFPNIAGSYWYNSTEYPGSWIDTDGDSVPDPADQWPTDWWNGAPHYAYNGTEYPGVFTDYDEDGVPDPADSWPADPENGLDSDGDGLANYSERTDHLTDPNDVDSDDDYLTDSEELLIYHTNPLLPISNAAGGQTLLDGYVHTGADTDDDGLPDLIEKHYRELGYGLSEDNPEDGAGDLDGDGVSNLQAYYQGLDLAANIDQYDRDGDGITDAVEDAWSAIYPGILDKTVFADAVGDHDMDGAFNFEEANVTGVDPGNPRSRWTGYPEGPLDGQIVAWRADVERLNFYEGMIDIYANPIPGPASSEFTTWDDSNPQNGLPEGYEYWIANRLGGTPPAAAACDLIDQDDDGMSNEWEYRHHFNLRAASDAGAASGTVGHAPPGAIPDQNDFINWAGYNAFVEGLPPGTPADPPWPNWGDVYAYDTAVLNCQSSVTAYAQAEIIDPDHDGLSNLREFILHTHPRVADSDGDGFDDGLEVAYGSNPLLRESLPPLTLDIQSGNNQVRAVGEDLQEALVVRTSRGGVPVAGVPVSFTVTSGGGTLAATQAGAGSATLTVSSSGSNGTAQAHLSAPTATGTRTITASAAGAASVAFSATAVPPLIITTSALPSADVNASYNELLFASGGQGGYAWSVQSGLLPEGLSLSSNGYLAGAATVLGSSTFTVQVMDSAGRVALRSYTIVVNALPLVITTAALTITTTSLPSGQVGNDYSGVFNATGGSGGNVWTLVDAEPPGLGFSAGAFTGTATTAGLFSVTVQVTDIENHSASKTLTIQINPPPAPPIIGGVPLPNAQVGTAYTASLTASGGSGGGYTWSILSGSPPPGITFSGGAFSGTPTTAGNSTFTLQLKDSAGIPASGSVTLTVVASTGTGTGGTGTGGTGGTGTGGTTAAAPVIFTSWRQKSMTFAGIDEKRFNEIEDDPGYTETKWVKDIPDPQPTNDGFNGDADEQNNLVETGDPRDEALANAPQMKTVDAEPDDDSGREDHETHDPTNKDDTGEAPHDYEQGEYTAKNGIGLNEGMMQSYSSSHVFVPSQGQALLNGRVWGTSDTHGWRGDGAFGVRPFTGALSWSAGEGAAALTWYYGDVEIVEEFTRKTEQASADWWQVRLQSNKAITDEDGARRTFVLTKVTTPLGAGSTVSPTTEVLGTVTLIVPKDGTLSTEYETTGTANLRMVTLGNVKAVQLNPTTVSKNQRIEESLLPIEFITPAGDPVNAPVDAGTTPASIPDGANEFTFSDATSGVLTMKLKAKVPGIGAMPAAEQAKFTFEVDTIGSSTFAWDGANPGGKATVSGDFITATATYTGLPQNNTDFGLKKARVKHGGNNAGEAKFEVFYPKDGTNHPGGQAGSKNWYHYWKVALGYADIEYKGAGPLFGEAPGMTGWSYALPKNKTVVYIYDLAATQDPGDHNSDHGKKKTTGIDTFVDTVLHEKKHTVQIGLADAVVGLAANSPWKHGWSWNRGAQHNHWSVGADGKPGVSGTDDDGDGTIDNLLVGGPGELGRGDDQLLDDGTGQEWPNAWGGMPPQPWAGGFAIEDQAYNTEPDAENAQAAKDWGNPGKQHKTVNKHDD